MSKIRLSNKEPKKRPMLTSKEKKIAKHVKKQGPDVRPISQRAHDAARIAAF